MSARPSGGRIFALMFRVLRAASAVLRGLADNLVYFLSGFFPRDRNLWVFGAWEGAMYRDNARYLFEHAVKTEVPRGRRVVWITRSADVARRLREKGLPVAEASTWRARGLCLRAGVIFVTHGRHDVIKSLTRGATVVFLNHALPIKHMGYDAKSIAYLHPTPLKKLFFKIVDPYWNIDFDYLLGASPQTAHIVRSSLRAEESRVWPLGFPRFAPLVAAARSNRSGAELRKILYMPTFRDRDGFSHFAYGFDLAELERHLEAMNAELMIALHPFDRSPVPPELKAPGRAGRARLFSPPDVNELLPDIDVLVTDFSSVAFDYLLLDRPMVFTQFDFEDFTSTQRGTYFAYDAVTPGPKVRDWPSLLSALEDALAGRDGDAARRAQVRRDFFRDDYSGVNQRIIEHVEKLAS